MLGKWLGKQQWPIMSNIFTQFNVYKNNEV